MSRPPKGALLHLFNLCLESFPSHRGPSHFPGRMPTTKFGLDGESGRGPEGGGPSHGSTQSKAYRTLANSFDEADASLNEGMHKIHQLVVATATATGALSCGTGDLMDIERVGKERTSLVSTPSSAELYRFAMNFLSVRKRKRKRNRDGKKRRR